MTLSAWHFWQITLSLPRRVFCGDRIAGRLIGPFGQLDVKLVPWSKSCSDSMLIAAPFRREYQSESTPRTMP